MASIGAALGLIAGMALLPLAASIFYGIGKVEPMVLAAVVVASAAVAPATTYAVARPWTRASSIDLLRR